MPYHLQLLRVGTPSVDRPSCGDVNLPYTVSFPPGFFIEGALHEQVQSLNFQASQQILEWASP